jgi:hypothetical protein
MKCIKASYGSEHHAVIKQGEVIDSPYGHLKVLDILFEDPRYILRCSTVKEPWVYHNVYLNREHVGLYWE